MKGAPPLDYQQRMAVAEDEAAAATLEAIDETRDPEARARLLTRARASAEQAAIHNWLVRRLRAFGYR
jgi:hypothetical protein